MLASDDMGQTKGDEHAKTKSDDQAAGEQKTKQGAAGPEAGQTEPDKAQSEAGRTKPQDTDHKESEAPDQAQQETHDQMAAAGAVPPPPSKPAPPTDKLKGPELKPSPHPQLKIGGDLAATFRPEAPAHVESRAAKVPGPDATEDEYLKYIRNVVTERLGALPQSLRAQARSWISFDILIQRNGQIFSTIVTESSGVAALDTQVVNEINGIGRFSPVPNYIGNQDRIRVMGKEMLRQ